MYTISCKACTLKSNERMDRVRRENPEVSERELFGLYLISLATKPVDPVMCPDCKIVSLIEFS